MIPFKKREKLMQYITVGREYEPKITATNRI